MFAICSTKGRFFQILTSEGLNIEIDFVKVGDYYSQ